MDFALELTPTATYYAEFYQEWLAQKWLRRWQSRLALLMILFWAVLYLLDSGKVLGIAPQLFILIGIYEFIKPYYSKYQWLKARRESLSTGQKIIIHFTNELIKIDGPFSSGTIKWTGIKEIKQTPNAVFLIPENGISIYLPKAVFQSAEDMAAVMNAKN